MRSDKALLAFRHEALLTRVARRLATDVSVVVVAAAAGQILPELPVGVYVVRDREPKEGPLTGLAAGLDILPEECEFVYATAVDAPFLAEGWIDRLAQRINGYDAAVANIDGRDHPLAALYRRAALQTAIADQTSAHDRSLRAVLAKLDVARLGRDDLLDVDRDLVSLININTPLDYQRALSLPDIARTSI